MDASPETELNALAAVYRFILDCQECKKGTRLGAPDDRRGLRNIRPQRSIPDKPDVPALVRELYSRFPEARYREPYELQSLVWSLGYCEDLIPECEIAAAIEVARTDWTLDEGAA